MFAQVAQIVGIVEIFEPRGIASEFLVVSANGARVLHSAVDHFLFPVPPDLKRYFGNHCSSEYGHQSDHEKQGEQNVAVLIIIPAKPAWGLTRA
jgi:hypothetical protein